MILSRAKLLAEEVRLHFEEGQMIQDSSSGKGRRIIETPTEEDVFSALGIPWIEPRDRIGPPKSLAKT